MDLLSEYLSMWRSLGVVGALLLQLSAPVRAQCPGDCGGNGVVSVDELVRAVRIALAQAQLSECAAADSNADGRVTVDDLVRAVNTALRGCAAPLTPTASETFAVATATPSASPAVTSDAPTASPSLTVTVEPSATATVGESETVTPSTSDTPTETATVDAQATATLTPSLSETVSATATPTQTGEETEMETGTATPTDTVINTQIPSLTPTGTSTLTAIPSFTRTSSPTLTPIPTQTRTPTASASPTSTPTGGPLGTRRFSLNPASSAFISVLAPDQQLEVTGFTGYLDLQAGAVNAQNGRAKIHVTGSSTYLQLVSDTGLICIKPLVPVSDAGVVDCNGGTNLGTVIRQDHRIGTVGVSGFTTQNCTDQGGTVEPGGFPHPQVCNGPLTVEPSAVTDSGPGAVAIGPDPTFSINGLPAELTFEDGPQCTGVGTGFSAVFVLLSASTRTQIDHVDNGSSSLLYENPGENFSCPAWTQENGPGKLILSFPTLHGAISGADVINVFVFDD